MEEDRFDIGWFVGVLLAAVFGVWIEDHRDFHARFRCCWRKFPLRNGLLRALGQNGIAAEDLGISHGAVRLDEDFQANDSADALGFQNRRISDRDFLHDLAGGVLRLAGHRVSQQHAEEQGSEQALVRTGPEHEYVPQKFG